MQQDNTIIQKLQQLDNQQLPDLSQMDAHWQRMEALLVSSTAPQKTGGKAIRWWLPAALLLVATVWLVYRYAQQPPATINTPVAAMATTSPVPGDTLPTAIWATSGDTLKLIQQAPQRPTVRQQGNGGCKNNSDDALNMAPPAKTDTQYFNINFIPCIDSTATDGKTPNLRQQWLNEFFTQLKKEPNRFVIDNRKDTILHCQEGTSLQIPAGSLGGYTGVEFTVTEVYKKSDMVLNQLSATSNKAMLESGGMLRLTASVGGQPVDMAPNNAITVYMADTSSYMQQMQLFTGEKTTERLPSAVMRMNEKLEDEVNGLSSTYMNWIPQYRLFARINTLQEARILELDDNTAKVTQQRKGAKAIFYRSPESKLSKAELRRLLNERYGAIYRTIKVKNYSTRNWLGIRKRYHNGLDIGDSIWVNKGIADKNKWPYTATRKTDILTADIVGIDTIAGAKMGKALRTIDNKYGININRLGWINCDRFSTPSEERTDYVVQLGDSAVNYYTLLVFDNINSLMNGYISGNTVVFPNVPLAMKVTVVSVGINRKGQSVYALQKAVVDKAGLAGLPFQPADAATLPNVLSKLDK